jgi:hypothetical protein
MKKQGLLGLTLLAAMSTAANAAVTLVDANDWKINMSGFVELDAIHDSTRSFNEVVGSTAVAKKGDIKHDNGRTLFSVRNSRLAFSVMPPVQDEWKTKGYMEFDLLGTNAPTSDAATLTNPTMRVRHAYFNAEKNGWTMLAGQTWSLFGWQPTYVPATASVPPVTGSLYQRNPQITFMKDMSMGEQSKLQAGLSIARPTQRDAEQPNLDVGVKFSTKALSSGFSSPNGDVKVEPMSIALSGTIRQFATPDSGAATAAMKKTSGSAFAADVMIPVIPASGDSAAGSMTLTAEFSGGKGYGDEFPSWSAGIAQMPAGAGAANNTNLDPGIGGFDGTNVFHLLNLQTWNAQLQYHLPGESHMFVTLGYGELKATGTGDITSPAPTYDKSSAMFANVFHDCTKQIRFAVEYAKFTTHYLTGESDTNDRYMLAGYFRF